MNDTADTDPVWLHICVGMQYIHIVSHGYNDTSKLKINHTAHYPAMIALLLT